MMLNASIIGCATPPASSPSAVVISQEAKLLPADKVKDAITVGRSTKADVLAALGRTLAISFDSGYEVWLYRLADDPRLSTPPGQRAARSDKSRADASAELVILFEPSGVVAKTRVRRAAARS
jgi:hypothetical protein